jgi:phosphoribosylamine--glycine ligase
MIIHAGTGLDSEGRVINTGGRVLAIVGTGPELTTARHAAYATIAQIELEGSFYRTDIARRAAEESAQKAAQE